MPYLGTSASSNFARLPFEEGRVRTSEHLRNVAEDTVEMLPFRNIWKASELFAASREREHNPIISAEEANLIWGIPDDGYGDGGVTFDKEITEEKAWLIHQFKLKERHRTERIAKGSDTFFRQGAALATGVAAQALDPINLGLMIAFPGMGVAKTTALGAKIGITGARVVQAASGVAVGVGVSEPFSYVSQWFGEQNEYGPKNTAMNIAAGLLLGTTINLTLGKIGDVLGDTAKALKDTPPSIQKKIINDAFEAVLNDEPINASASQKSATLEQLHNNSKRAHNRMELDTDEGAGLVVKPLDKSSSEKLADFSKKRTEEAKAAKKTIAVAETEGKIDRARKKVELKQRSTEPIGGHVYKYGDTELYAEAHYTAGGNSYEIEVLNTGSPEEYRAVLWHLFKKIDDANQIQQNRIRETGESLTKTHVRTRFVEDVYVNGRPYDMDDIHEFVTGNKPSDAYLKNKPGSNLDVEDKVAMAYAANGLDPNPQAGLAKALAVRRHDLINAIRDPSRLRKASEFGIEGGTKRKIGDTPPPKEAPAPKPKDTPEVKPKEAPEAKPKDLRETAEADAARVAEAEAAGQVEIDAEAQAEFEKSIFDDFEELEDALYKRMEDERGRGTIDDAMDDLDSDDLSGLLDEADEAMMARLDEELDNMGFDAEAKQKIMDELDSSEVSNMRNAIDAATNCLINYRM